jgi:hypothetical protein
MFPSERQAPTRSPERQISITKGREHNPRPKRVMIEEQRPD